MGNGSGNERHAASSEQPASEQPAGESSSSPEVRTKSAGDPGVGGSSAPPEKVLRAKDLLAGLLSHMGVECEVEVRDSAEAIRCSVVLRAHGEVLNAGPRGLVLEALQYLLNKMVNREVEGRKLVTIELGSFGEVTVDPEMDRMAIQLGESAKRIGKTLTIVPIQAKDRRRIHLAMGHVGGVATRSEGEGLFRRLLVEPKPKGN